MKKPFGIILIATIFVLSCTKTHSKEKTGSLTYRSDFKVSHRILERSGKFLTGHYQLSYDAPPKGVHDGDSGSDFYIKIIDDSLLKAGSHYILPQKGIDIYIAEWAAPAGSDVYKNENLKGQFEVLDYKPYKNLTLKVDLQYQYSPGKWRDVKTTISFLHKSEWVRSLKSKDDLEWYAWHKNSPIQQQNFKGSDLDGKWQSCEAFVYINNEMQERVRCKNPSYLEIKDSSFRENPKKDFQKFSLINNAFTHGSYETYINFLSSQKLILTRVGHAFHHQYIYTKISD